MCIYPAPYWIYLWGGNDDESHPLHLCVWILEHNRNQNAVSTILSDQSLPKTNTVKTQLTFWGFVLKCSMYPKLALLRSIYMWQLSKIWWLSCILTWILKTVNFVLENTPPDILCNGKNKQKSLNSFIRYFLSIKENCW